jgi:uncharacterized protein HemY
MLSHLLAAVLFEKDDVRTARGLIEASLTKRPDNAAALLLAARIARADKDFNAALTHLDSAISIAPQRHAFVEKARTLDQAGLRQQAREATAGDPESHSRSPRGRRKIGANSL